MAKTKSKKTAPKKANVRAELKGLQQQITKLEKLKKHLNDAAVARRKQSAIWIAAVQALREGSPAA